MKGIYIIDFTNGYSFVIYGESYEDACLIIKASYQYQLEGSYHFYPLLQGETPTQAELRVYIMLSHLMPSTKLLSSKETNEELAKRTYPPNFQRILSNSDISVSLTRQSPRNRGQASSESDTQFNISL